MKEGKTMTELWDMILEILYESGADEAAVIAIKAVKKFFGIIGK